MNQAIQIGQVQPSVLSKVESTVKNLKARLQQKVTDSEFCCVIGLPLLFEPVASVMWAVTIGFVLLLGLAGWLEGGAL